MPPTQHDFPTHKHSFRSLVLGYVGKYFHATCILTPFFLAPTSFDTTSTLTNYILNQTIFPLFFERLQTRPRLWIFIWLFQVNIPTHAKFIFKWSFWDGFRTPLRLLSPRRFCKWILTVVSTLLSYCTRSHSTSNYTYLWGSMLFRHDQTFRWNLSHCHKGSIVLTRKPYFMPSISQCLCNTFLPTPIQNSNQGWMWRNNPWHLGPSL
jgi:hypothetical protein